MTGNTRPPWRREARKPTQTWQDRVDYPTLRKWTEKRELSTPLFSGFETRSLPATLKLFLLLLSLACKA